MAKYDEKIGDEVRCPRNSGGHEPDWDTVSVEDDGDESYVDVHCKHCGRSGCVGKASTLIEDLSW